MLWQMNGRSQAYSKAVNTEQIYKIEKKFSKVKRKISKNKKIKEKTLENTLFNPALKA